MPLKKYSYLLLLKFSDFNFPILISDNEDTMIFIHSLFVNLCNAINNEIKHIQYNKNYSTTDHYCLLINDNIYKKDSRFKFLINNNVAVRIAIMHFIILKVIDKKDITLGCQYDSVPNIVNKNINEFI